MPRRPCGRRPTAPDGSIRWPVVRTGRPCRGGRRLRRARGPDPRWFAWRMLEPYGWSNSLAQKLVQLTMPGVPDVYQGASCFEGSLADPGQPASGRLRPTAPRCSPRLRGDYGPRRVSPLPWPSCGSPARPCTPGAIDPSCSPGTGRSTPASAGRHHLVAFDRGGAVTVATRLPVRPRTGRRMG